MEQEYGIKFFLESDKNNENINKNNINNNEHENENMKNHDENNSKLLSIQHPNILFNYALFLAEHKKDYRQAENFF